MRLAVLLLFLAPSLAMAQEPGSSDLPHSGDPSNLVLPPIPQMGWVLSSNAPTIPAAFGSVAMVGVGQGFAPAVAMDGGGNIDGAAMIAGNLAGQRLHHYALQSSAQPTLHAGTTVLMLCGRENNWLPGPGGGLLPVTLGNTWGISKPGEWGINLVSKPSPFAVVIGGQWVYSNAPPVPESFVAFDPQGSFPPLYSNSQECVWGFYDTSLKGSLSAPQISVAYDDGEASAPVTLRGPVTNSPDPLEVFLSQLGEDIGTLYVWQGSDAERLFQRAARSAYWNSGMRTSIASRFQTPPWSGLSVTRLNPRPVALGGDALDNVWAVSYPSFVRTSPFAHYSVTTSPGTPFIVVRYQLGSFQRDAWLYSVSFALDGRYVGYDQPWRFGTNQRTIPLPLDGQSHTVELRNGFTMYNGDYKDPTTGSFGGGGFVDAVAVPAGSSVRVNHPVPGSVALVLSHSVAVGYGTGRSPFQGQGAQSSTAWPLQARAIGAFGTSSVVDESYSGQLLANDCLTQAACTTYLKNIRAAQPRITVGFAARMLNDFYVGRRSLNVCLPQYKQALQNLFNAWAAVFPGVPLYVGSDIRQSSANESKTDGCTPQLQLSDWREAIRSTVQAYAGSKNETWLHSVDMSNWVPPGDLSADGIHPSVKGQVDICNAVAQLFNRQVSCGVPQ